VIARVTEQDLDELLALMRAYCDFYEVAPSDEALLELSRALLADPRREGIQLIARDDDGRAIGFATVYWTWSTTTAARLAVMNDLFVSADARGSGAATALIEASRDAAAEHGAKRLAWQTALDNERAQRVYDRLGAKRSQWLDYDLQVVGEE
jgi:GNAT superfamily N-acetyltransferase